ncbi:DUF934 domain-containing protein [Jiella sp. MQZ9-1]|uniref:DUF934 domain-containing protein n=1 Tax=Jiella flava TaxID=2816857 RepID=A0A939FSX1_9HYPH|nr:DUF934 domain-containing protein [Jiella flava]MBO0661328.1 DUF934 domain-containing protein [Jiella flava]MCD2469973.1 DUF934 domain-containing protein [Jiella flava]
MTLITKTGAADDRFTRFDTLEDALATDEPVLIPLAFAPAYVEQRPGAEFGISVPGSAAIEDVAPHLETAALVAVEFPSFADGRGFSLARKIVREGFAGTLRASGPLIADQFLDALACGFTEVELPETMANRQPAQQWLSAKETMSDHYQSGYGTEPSILQKRLAARKGASV